MFSLSSLNASFGVSFIKSSFFPTSVWKYSTIANQSNSILADCLKVQPQISPVVQVQLLVGLVVQWQISLELHWQISLVVQ
jgi:hypothetical protein